MPLPINRSIISRAVTESFAYQGEVFPLHEKPRGAKSAHLPPEATIFFAKTTIRSATAHS